jgi:hypothetical protein
VAAARSTSSHPPTSRSAILGRKPRSKGARAVIRTALASASEFKHDLFPSAELPHASDLAGLGDESAAVLGGRLLGVYDEAAILEALARYGITAKVAARGFGSLSVVLAARDPARQRVRVWSQKRGHDELLLGDLLIAESTYTLPPTHPAHGLRPLRALVIQWILLQDPRRAFTPERPALPGQHYPGLGVSHEMRTMISMLGKNNGFDLVVNAPEFFHNAVMYHPSFVYADPARQGLFRAFERDLRAVGLAAASWGLYLGCVCDTRTHERVQWFHDEQVCPVSDDVSAAFRQPQYYSAVEAAMAAHTCTFDHARYQLFNPLCPDGSPTQCALERNPFDTALLPW